jgi:hypothetical protein
MSANELWSAQSDILIAIAALGMGLAGFSGVMVSLRPDPTMWPLADTIRLKTLLQFSLGTVFLCLMSFVFFYAGWVEPKLWRFSSGLTVLVATPTTISFIYKMRRRYRDKLKGTLSSPILWSLTGITAGILVIQILNYLGWPWSTQFWPFLLALVWGITNASIAFYRIVFNRPAESYARRAASQETAACEDPRK